MLAALSLIAGLLGKVRLFLIVFAAVWLLIAAVTYYDYQVHVVPGFGVEDGGDGLGIGFAFALAYMGTSFVAMFGAFCIGFAVSSLARWMKTL
ncbi:hypothetical protein AADA15_10000 [Phycobacter sp. 'Weihai']